jgi:hypothetical protein
MGIDAVWKDERGLELGRVDDSNMVLSRFIRTTHELSQTTCLRFLDPFGDACYNQLQLPVLAAELRAATSTDVAAGVRQHLENVLALAERAKNHVHTYFWFVGD